MMIRKITPICALFLLCCLPVAGCVDAEDPVEAGEDTDLAERSDSETPPLPYSDPDKVYSEWENPACEGQPVLSEVVMDVTDGANKFAFNLFPELLDRTDGNLSFSPLSLHTAWGLVYNGATGSAADELQAALGLKNRTLEEVNQGFSDLLETERDTDVVFEQANALWVSDDYQGMMVEAYTEVLETTFNALCTVLDFGDPAASAVINQWVSDHTNGLIEKLVEPPISSSAVLFLTNAVYFNAPWTKAFLKDETVPRRFTYSDNTTTDLDTMRANQDVRYGEGNTYTLAELAYANGVYAMSIVLPNQDATMDDTMAEITDKGYAQLHRNLRNKNMVVQLPRFEVKFDAAELHDGGLIGALKDIGIRAVFAASGINFSKMLNFGGDLGAKVSDVKHKTYLRVDEDGSEAAAATLIDFQIVIDGGGGAIPRFEVDRPFLYIIHDRCSGVILFMGVIEKPTPVE